MKTLKVLGGLLFLFIGGYSTLSFLATGYHWAEGIVPVAVAIIGFRLTMKGFESKKKTEERHSKRRHNANQLKRTGNALVGSFKKGQMDSFEFLENQFNKAKKEARKRISKDHLTGCTWIQIEPNKNVFYTFRNNGELIVTTDGNVQRWQYELIVDNNTILITSEGLTVHFNIFNVKDDFVFMNKISTDVKLAFANYTKYKDELQSFLQEYTKQYS